GLALDGNGNLVISGAIVDPVMGNLLASISIDSATFMTVNYANLYQLQDGTGIIGADIAPTTQGGGAVWIAATFTGPGVGGRVPGAGADGGPAARAAFYTPPGPPSRGYGRRVDSAGNGSLSFTADSGTPTMPSIFVASQLAYNGLTITQLNVLALTFSTVNG